MAATGWSCPATVSTAPAGARDHSAVPQVPGGDARRPFPGKDPGAQAGYGQGIGPDLAAALVDETGPGRQRWLANRVPAEREDDPFGHAHPGPSGAGPHAAAAQPQQLGQAGLARPPKTGRALEPAGERRELPGSLLQLTLAAVIEPGDHRRGQAGAIEKYAALAEPGHADAAHADRAPRRSGRPHGGPDQVDGHAEQAACVDLGLAAVTRVPWGPLLGIRGARPVTGGTALRHRPGHGLR